jgi:hypothetical protein
LERESAELRAAVDSQSGQWFDDIWATVLKKLEEGMLEAGQLHEHYSFCWCLLSSAFVVKECMLAGDGQAISGQCRAHAAAP